MEDLVMPFVLDKAVPWGRRLSEYQEMFDRQIETFLTTKLLRILTEVRIFPICDLDGNKTILINEVIDYFSKTFHLEIVKSNYEFQNNANEMLILTKF